MRFLPTFERPTLIVYNIRHIYCSIPDYGHDKDISGLLDFFPQFRKSVHIVLRRVRDHLELLAL